MAPSCPQDRTRFWQTFSFSRRSRSDQRGRCSGHGGQFCSEGFSCAPGRPRRRTSCQPAAGFGSWCYGVRRSPQQENVSPVPTVLGRTGAFWRLSRCLSRLAWPDCDGEGCLIKLSRTAVGMIPAGHACWACFVASRILVQRSFKQWHKILLRLRPAACSRRMSYT